MTTAAELPLQYRQNFLELKAHLEQLGHWGLADKDPAFIDAFAHTYLRCLTLYAQLKNHPQGAAWMPGLQPLLLRANLVLYPEQGSTWRRFWHWLWVETPAQLWAARGFHFTSLLILLVTGVMGYLIVRQNFEMASVFIPPFLRSTHELEAYLFSTDAQQQMLTSGRELGVEMKSVFATYLFLNNTKVAVLCFLSGILYGIPTVMILIQTGLMTGTLPALFVGGDIWGLWAWLLPHGVPEFSAIILAGGLGLQYGLAMLNPGPQGTGAAIRRTIVRSAGTVLVCVILLVWAAVVESFLRQSALPQAERLWVAAGSLLPLTLLWVRAACAARAKQQANEREPDAVDLGPPEAIPIS